MVLVKILQESGHIPHILSRGYGRSSRTHLLRVNPQRHRYQDVGDEPLLLSRIAPTWVSSNRVDSAQAAIKEGATILIMDDGFQNPSLHKDWSIIVIDTQRAIGNGYTLPAGPLREPLQQALERAQAVVCIGESALSFDIPLHLHVMKASITSQPPPSSETVLGFSGIGDPSKFHRFLIQLGYNVLAFKDFPDHYDYKVQDIQKLLHQKKQLKASFLITTEKDACRIPDAYRSNMTVLKMSLEIKEIEILCQNLAHMFPTKKGLNLNVEAT